MKVKIGSAKVESLKRVEVKKEIVQKAMD